MKTIIISFLVFLFSISGISQTYDSIDKSTDKKPNKEIKGKPGSKRKQRGFTNITELDIAYGGVNVENYGSDNQFSTGLQTINGYQFSPYFSAGLGLGFIVYYQYQIPGIWEYPYVLTPLFVDFRVNFQDRPLSPFFSLDSGCIFYFNNTYVEVGTYINPNLGIKFFISPKTAMNLSLGYRYHANTITIGNFGKPNENVRQTLNMISLKIGFTL